jgi:hypothetical protein
MNFPSAKGAPKQQLVIRELKEAMKNNKSKKFPSTWGGG